MNPASHMRVVLCECRDRGFDFEAAWVLGMRALPRSADEIDEWRITLHNHKHYWRAAYARQRVYVADVLREEQVAVVDDLNAALRLAFARERAA